MLLLDDTGETVLVFVLAEPPLLEGPEWKVTALNNGKGGVATVMPEATVTLALDGAGKVVGSAGCNRYKGVKPATRQ